MLAVLQKVIEHACAQLTLVGVSAGNAGAGEGKAILISSVSPEGFLACSRAGDASWGWGCSLTEEYLDSFCQSRWVTPCINVKEGWGNNQENCNFKLQLSKTRCLPLELWGLITLGGSPCCQEQAVTNTEVKADTSVSCHAAVSSVDLFSTERETGREEMALSCARRDLG